MTGRRVALIGRLLAVVAGLALLLQQAGLSTAQTPEGATMTVLRGQVAVVRPNGQATQPAPSGTTVFPGDEIRTVDQSGALITFFVGTEIELGADTVLVVERVSKQGERVEVFIKQVFGSTLSRLQTFSDPGSSYRIEAGGNVAAARGTEFLVLWRPPFLVVLVVSGQVDCNGRTLSRGAYWGMSCSDLEPYEADVDDR